MRPENDSPHHRVARVARRQHGVVSLRQLIDAGLSRESVKRRAREGLLHRVHRGVYGVGHPPKTVEAVYMAAVLACGPGALLCGRAAAHLYGLVSGAPPVAEVAATRRRTVPGVRARRSRGMPQTVFRAIPVATVPSVVVDMAGRLDLEQLARVCHQARVRYGVGLEQVEAAVAPGSPGVTGLRAVYGGDVRLTLSRLEQEFLAVLRTELLPLPQTNRAAGGRYVDCRWPERRLTIELDSFRYHGSRHAWELDRRREREARARGDEFRRYTWSDVFEDRAAMLDELHALLGAG